MLILQIQMAKICKQVQQQRCLRNRLRLRQRLQLQRQPLRHCCRKCDNLATNMRWLPGGWSGWGGSGGGSDTATKRRYNSMHMCGCAGVDGIGWGGRNAAYARLHLSAKHKNETKWRTSRQLPERLLRTHTRALHRLPPPRQALPCPCPHQLQTYCRFPTGNCQLVPLLSSDPFCAALNRAPLRISPPPPFAKLPQQLEHRNKCAFMASNSKVFKIFTFHALCVFLRQATEPSHFFYTPHIPCKLHKSMWLHVLIRKSFLCITHFNNIYI